MAFASYNNFIKKGAIFNMLKENIKLMRKAKGLSQEELAIKLHVVRQTVSKWEQGLSVPDSQMLISISNVFETSVSVLLGEDICHSNPDDLKVIAEKLEVINLQLLQKRIRTRKILHWVFISFILITIVIFISLALLQSPYLNKKYQNLETAVLGMAFHSFEWLFFRIAPFALIIFVVGALLTRKKD